MPLYVFHCEKCEIEEEVLQSYNDDPPLCDSCKKIMKRALTSALVRKGAGIYSIDTGTKSWGDLDV